MPLALYLVRHATPEISPAAPASQWHLSPEGQRRAGLLADQLAGSGIQAVISSPEPKALQTARPIARRLGLEVETGLGLHEHERSRVAFSSPQAFNASVQRFFDQPAELVFGDETADAAYRRFSGAVEAALLSHPGLSLAIVAHGTVISLLVSRRCGLKPFPLWKQLGLPAYLVLSLPDFNLLETHFDPIPPLLSPV